MRPWPAVLGLLAVSAGLSGSVAATARIRRFPPAVPASLILQVRETAGVARVGEVVRSGVPLPRSWNLRDTASLAVLSTSDALIRAEYKVLARWNAALTDTTAPIQWLLVSFPASVSARGTASYRLVTIRSNVRPPAPVVRVSRVGAQVRVNTGAATFALGADAGSLFDEILLANGTRVATGTPMTVRAEGKEWRHLTTRRIAVEHSGPLAAVVAVEGTYNMPAVGGGTLASRRRYVFTANSPTAIVRHSVAWEGDRFGNGILSVGGVPNGVRLQQVRNGLTPNLGAAAAVTAVGDFEAPAVQGDVTSGQGAAVRQHLRGSRLAPLSFDVSVGGQTAGGGLADGGMLAVSGARGTLAIGLNHMHRYEPQALRLLADGRLAVDVADDQLWLGAHQGLFATMAVTALPSQISRADLDRFVWAPLNRPLRAWPQANWFAASEAVEEFPVGTLPATWAGYDSHVGGLMTKTSQLALERGLSGLMSFGVYPRYWALPTVNDEIGRSLWDPTPGETWDDVYWGTTWTDYHNTVATVPVWAMRSGEVQWLDELAFPGALRTLHTQIMQAAPDDPYFYAGQAPSGYGGYRTDFNHSHSYFENLMLYYWLTGDETVVQTLKRGASSMRQFLCSRRPGAVCLPTDPPVEQWAELTGRGAMEWYTVFRFIGLADDASYLDDWRSGLARAVTRHYVEAQQNGVAYGFWLNGQTPVTGPGTYVTDQIWMTALYDLNLLHRLQRDTNDAPIGEPALRPSRILTACARSLARFAPSTSPESDGTVNGPWPNALRFTWSGARIGGQLSGVTAELVGSDPYLYPEGKACLTAAIARAAVATGDPALMPMATQLSQYSLAAARADVSPLGKLQGLYLSRLHAAIAQLSTP